MQKKKRKKKREGGAGEGEEEIKYVMQNMYKRLLECRIGKRALFFILL